MPIWEQYIKEFLLSSIDDGISYVEARINFLAKYVSALTSIVCSALIVRTWRFMTGPDGVENVPHREWLVVFDRVVNEVKAELESQGRQDEFVGAKVIILVQLVNTRAKNGQIIYTTIRFLSPEELEWYVEDALALKQEFPHLICGAYRCI